MRSLANWFLLAALGGCASPKLDGVRFHCDSDADCADGELCGVYQGVAACLAAVDSPIRIGMSAPLQGPSQGLGIEMRRGIQSFFQRKNAEGGVLGRPLELSCLNDNYDPELAHTNMVELLDITTEIEDPDSPDERGVNGVFAILGNVGTPTMLRTAPVANKNHVVFFAPFTGAQQYLRDGTNSPYVYNYRAGYYDETQAMLDYIAKYRQPRIVSDPPGESYRHIIAFTQRDTYGNAGYNGLVNAYNRLAPLPQPDFEQPNPSIARVYYDREDLDSVEPAIVEAETLLTGILGDGTVRQSVAILMVDTYQPANKFIRAVKDWVNADVVRATQLDVQFMNVSFVGSDSLASALTAPPETYVDVRDGVTRKAYAEGVMVTQVVPHFGGQAEGVAQYRADIDAFDGGTPSFTSLEGYIAAALFTDALERQGSALDTEALRHTLDEDTQAVDLGIGTLLGFTSTKHQASDTVWGSVIQADGTFQVPFTWNPTTGIQPN